MKIELLGDYRCHLGEGPLWDYRRGWLYWVDSLAPRLYRHDFARSQIDAWDLPGQQVGSLAPAEQGGLILAMDRGFYRFDIERGTIELIAEPLASHPALRLNDGKVDPFGNFIAGAMNIDHRKTEACPVYRLKHNLEVETLLDGFVCFNGPCFDAGGETLYLSGRIDGLIEAYDYFADARPVNGRALLADCNPDGATVDAEGYIWSAQWDDACLLRIDPEGRIDYRLPIPGQIVSSLAFGGPDLDLIFVTTAGGEVHGALPRHRDAGRLLVVQGSGFRGRPEPQFKG